MAIPSGRINRPASFLVLCLGLVLWAGMALAAPYAAHVMDARTGETLYARNADQRLHPASLTKMLTLYIAFDAIERGEISLDTIVTVSKHAAGQPPSRLGLRPGQRIALRHLIRAAALKSANDAATAIGEALSGSEPRFAERMNRTARALGMTNSTFKNANGLTAPGHLSTARDMSILGRRLFYDFPQYYNIFSRRTADAGIAPVANTNRRFLDAYEGADGIKTGYTVAAGFNLTASAQRGQKRIIATVFGGSSTAQRNAKMAELLDIGFGEAPARAREEPPPPADLTGEDPDLVASVAGGAGKTVRVLMTMKTSPRPVPRPAAPAAVALAEAGAATPPPSTDEAAAAAAAVVAMQDVIADVVAEAAAPEPPPFAMVSPEDAQALGLAPPPDTAAPEAVAVAEAEAGRAATDPALVAEAAPATASPLPEPEAADPVDLAEAAPAELPAPLAASTAALPFAMIAPEDLAALGAPAPAPTGPDASPVELAAVAAQPALRPLPTAVPEEPEPETVTRVSTSGGRNWGVSLGRHASHGAAERVLTKAVLGDSVALGEGLRKVVTRKGGFDATVLGLTEDQALLACRRMRARAQDCDVLAP